MAFPTSPTHGQTYQTENGTIYIYDSADNKWVLGSTFNVLSGDFVEVSGDYVDHLHSGQVLEAAGIDSTIDDFYFDVDGNVNIRPSNDIDNYFRFKTVANIPIIKTEGATEGILSGFTTMRASADIDFRPDNDNDNYIRMKTSTEVPRIDFMGVNSGYITNLGDPLEDHHAVTKHYLYNTYISDTYHTGEVYHTGEIDDKLTGYEVVSGDYLVTSGDYVVLSGDYVTVSGVADSALQNVVEDTTPQLGGDLDTNFSNILLYSGITTDHTANGIIITGTVGANIFGFGASLYVSGDGQFYETNAASGATGVECWGLALEDGVGQKPILIMGSVRDDSWSWTPGNTMYLDAANTGAMTDTLPSGSALQVQKIGKAIGATEIIFNPSKDVVEWLE